VEGGKGANSAAARERLSIGDSVFEVPNVNKRKGGDPPKNFGEEERHPPRNGLHRRLLRGRSQELTQKT